jgi:hypothetical protein
MTWPALVGVYLTCAGNGQCGHKANAATAAPLLVLETRCSGRRFHRRYLVGMHLVAFVAN